MIDKLKQLIEWADKAKEMYVGMGDFDTAAYWRVAVDALRKAYNVLTATGEKKQLILQGEEPKWEESTLPVREDAGLAFVKELVERHSSVLRQMDFTDDGRLKRVEFQR